MDLHILFFTVTYRIIHVTVMSQNGDDFRKKELKLQKCWFFLCFIGLIITVNIE